MSKKEREAMLVLERVVRGEMKLTEAAEVMSLSYRQSSRLKGRYEKEGAYGLVHRSRGRETNRRTAAATRKKIEELYGGRYKGMGPVYFTEKLWSEHEIRVDHETVRRMLIKAGLWQLKGRKLAKHKPWREPKGHFGEMVQMDGSHHRWFGDRGEQCCLMVMIDDATGRRMSLMSKQETTEAAMRILWRWIDRYGVPKSLYVDKKNVFVPAEKDAENARIEGRQCLTQFGRACKLLGIEIIRAHSPEAKGRVERTNKVYQDRLVNELLLKEISGIDETNEMLQSWFDNDLNERFARPPRESADYHRSAEGLDLAAIFCIEQERKLSAHWTLSFENRVYQIRSHTNHYSPARTSVQIRSYLDGRLHMFYRGIEVEFHEIDPKEKESERTSVPPSVTGAHVKAKGRRKPAPDHPWRRSQTHVPPPASDVVKLFVWRGACQAFLKRSFQSLKA
ncbi:MAG: ISNCY family transposase [Acidobacteria bacterium]|nr:ISNCY family transposase [Acidobacteriota bacterium]